MQLSEYSANCKKNGSQRKKIGEKTRLKIICVKPNSHALVDDEDYPRMALILWHLSGGYAIGRYLNKTVGMHRLVMGLFDKREIDQCPSTTGAKQMTIDEAIEVLNNEAEFVTEAKAVQLRKDFLNSKMCNEHPKSITNIGLRMDQEVAIMYAFTAGIRVGRIMEAADAHPQEPKS